MSLEHPRKRRVVVVHEGGTRFRVHVRGHEFLVDQPVSAGGTNEAPTPTEAFIGSLASCAAYYGRTYLALRGLPDRVDVIADWEFGKAPDRVATVRLVVEAPGLPPERADVFRRVVGSCLVHNTLTVPPDVVVELGVSGLDEAGGAG